MYSTAKQVRLRLSPGGNASGTAASGDQGLDDGQIAEAIARGDATIDSCLLARYTIPTADWTDPEDQTVATVAVEPVNQFSVSLGTYFATLSYRRGLDLSATSPVYLEYVHTMRLLTAIRDGKASLQLPPVGGVPGQTGSDATVYNLYDGTLFAASQVLRPERNPMYARGWGEW